MVGTERIRDAPVHVRTAVSGEHFWLARAAGRALPLKQQLVLAQRLDDTVSGGPKARVVAQVRMSDNPQAGYILDVWLGEAAQRRVAPYVIAAGKPVCRETSAENG